MASMITDILLAISNWTELAILAKTTLMLSIGLAVSVLVRRRAASVRHLVLVATFGTLLALPVIVFSGPSLAVRVRVQPATAPALLGPEALISPPPAAPQSPSGVTASIPSAPTMALPSWTVIVRFVWISGTIIFLALLGLDFWRLRRLRRNGLPAPDLTRNLRAIATESGIACPVELLLHESIAAPFTCGFSRPAILLPFAARSWGEDALRRALVHELEHVRRFDWASQLLARAACACFWFHPLIWVAWRWLCLNAERACDDAVLQREEGTDYADQLVSLASQYSDGTLASALGMARRGDLSVRVSAILDDTQSRGRASRTVMVATLAVAVMAITAIAPVRAVAQVASDRQLHRATEMERTLFNAAEAGDIPAMERQLNSGANVNARLDGDGSALIAAARNGHLQAVQLLLDYGADLNLAVRGNGSPLIMAALNGHLDTARLLLDRGADVHLAVPGDGNPLIMAARGGHVDMVQLLLDRGAKIEQVVPGDENSLIEASASGRLNVVKLLANRGANVNARVWAERPKGGGGEWRTPLNMARRRGHAEVISFLQAAGAR